MHIDFSMLASGIVTNKNHCILLSIFLKIILFLEINMIILLLLENDYHCRTQYISLKVKL